MGRISPKKKAKSIKIKQNKKAKLAKLRQKYIQANNKSEKETIWQKAMKLSSFLTKEEFEKPASQ